MPWLFFLLPFLELWTLIELGGEIGGFTTVLYVFATIVLGMTLIRRQGLVLLQQMQRDAERGFFGPQLLMDDLALVTSGLLLMIPGLITDVSALLVMIGPLRRRLVGLGASAGHWEVHSTHYRDDSTPRDGGPGQDAHRTTIEGDFRRLDDD
jgi:UPF0716 protein FxsA